MMLGMRGRSRIKVLKREEAGSQDSGSSESGVRNKQEEE
jgi:hypothetical protein